MTGKLKRFWFLLVIILNEIASTTPCSTFNCRLSTTCRCNSKDLTTVPQKLPRRITELYLNTNDIATIHPSSFSRYRRLIKLNLSQNRITSIPAGTFSGLPDLKELHLSSNKITTIQRGAFTNLLQLQKLYLNTNNINTIQSGGLSNLRQLRMLDLSNNRMQALPLTTYSMLSSIRRVKIDRNPWQCDCRMLPFRLEISRFRSFKDQIICSQPAIFFGERLKDINPKDFDNCLEPTILSFRRVDNDTSVQEETLHLVCEVSGMPKPDITVTLPSGPNTNAMSGGRVTVEVKNTTATVTITGVTAADAGQYTCIATNPSGSASATLSVNVHNDLPSITTKFNASPPSVAATSTHPTSNSNLASSPAFSLAAPAGSTPSEHLESKTFSPAVPDVDVTSSEHPLSYYTTSIPVPVGTTHSEHLVSSPNSSSPVFGVSTPSKHFVSSPSSSLPGSTPGPSEHLPSSKTFFLPVNTSTAPEEQTESDPTFSVPVLVHSSPPEEPESDPNPSLSVLIATMAGAAAGTVVICSIVLTLCWKLWTRNRSTVAPDRGVVYNSTDTTHGVLTDSTATETTGAHNHRQMQHHDADA
ncbi:uncharacterized protein LOC144916892 [Branchiostoma floridae x Branchiostoma belcheri]